MSTRNTLINIKNLMVVAVGALIASLGASNFAYAAPSYTAFESGQVRPMALSLDKKWLLVVNTPDNHLEVFRVKDDGSLRHKSSIPVGLEPVSVAISNIGEAWVVNHLSDSVSIVKFNGSTPHVVRTLLVGDEPNDVVFTANGRAFVTTAHRGQHRTHRSISSVPGWGDPELMKAGEPRADVWVLDANNLGSELGGKPLKIIELFGDSPRALAVSNDGNNVYVAIFKSGNQTAAVSEGTVCEHYEAPCNIKGQTVPNDTIGPKVLESGERTPKAGVIVKRTGDGKFVDPEGVDWTDVVKFDLPDKDVFVIDSRTLRETQAYTGVGTTLFNMAVNPVNNAIYVSNTEANNFDMFEGFGLGGNPSLQGHLALSRITVIKNGQVSPRYLNKHIDYDVLPAPAGTKSHSLATPLQMVVSGDGSTLAVAAFGSSKIGLFNTSELENDSFQPELASRNYVVVSGGGPSGMVWNEDKERMYVLTRFDNSISVIDVSDKQEIDKISMYNPEPTSLVQGRKFLYDANLTSSNGEASCSSCHIFGDMDQLAWNLGNPEDEVTVNPVPILLGQVATTNFPGLNNVKNLNGVGKADRFHPLKGPMTTQTLKGMVNHGSMHWRGDRSTGFYGSDPRQTPPFDSDLAFRNFLPAFVGLNGRDSVISDAQMQQFADFALQLTLPPNPVRNLDNSLTRAQVRGEEFFFGCDTNWYEFVICVNGRPLVGEGHRVDGLPLIGDLGHSCEGCHTMEPENGFFGTDGSHAFDMVHQTIKVPHFRNSYLKAGMFGNAPNEGILLGDNGFKGDQVKGYGFLHDGSVDTLKRFFRGDVFDDSFLGTVGFFNGDPQREDVVDFVNASDNDIAPIVGQQITYSATHRTSDVVSRVNLLLSRSRAPFKSKILGRGARECDLVAHGLVNTQNKGWYYNVTSGTFSTDSSSEPSMGLSALLGLVNSGDNASSITFTCVPYGSGRRIGIDRDMDGILNRNET